MAQEPSGRVGQPWTAPGAWLVSYQAEDINVRPVQATQLLRLTGQAKPPVAGRTGMADPGPGCWRQTDRRAADPVLLLL